MQTKRNIVIITILLIIAGVLVFSSSFFMIASIDYDETTVATVGYQDLFTDENIENTTTIRKGSSIFVIDLNKVRESIEFKAPKLKVNSVIMISQNKVKIDVSVRGAKYYYISGEEYFILDADLKVLEKTTDKLTETNYKRITFQNGEPSVLVGKSVNEEVLREYLRLFSLNNKESILKEITMTEDKIIFETQKNITFKVDDNLEKITHVAGGKDIGKFATLLGVYETAPGNTTLDIIIDSNGEVKVQ